MMDLDECGAVIFGGRSRNSWSERPVTPDLLERLYDRLKLGPTSMNSAPARFRFVVSQDAKARLAPHLMEANRAKALASPCVAIIAYDARFFDKLPELYPIREGLREMFAMNQVLAESTAFRNGTLQGAYLMMAARTLGLDCGPMSGFNPAGVDEAFFAGTALKTNFLCSLGYADDQPYPRLPRLDFAQAAQIL